MVVERRYSVSERNKADKVDWKDQLLSQFSPGRAQTEKFYDLQTELVDCANRLGAEMLGLQAELDKSVCSNEVSEEL